MMLEFTISDSYPNDKLYILKKLLRAIVTKENIPYKTILQINLNFPCSTLVTLNRPVLDLIITFIDIVIVITIIQFGCLNGL